MFTFVLVSTTLFFLPTVQICDWGQAYPHLIVVVCAHLSSLPPACQWLDLRPLLFLIQVWQTHLFESTSRLSSTHLTTLWPVRLLKLSWVGCGWVELLKKHPEFSLEVGVAFQQHRHLSFKLQHGKTSGQMAEDCPKG